MKSDTFNDRIMKYYQLFGFGDSKQNQPNILPFNSLSIKSGGSFRVDDDRRCLLSNFFGSQEMTDVFIVSLILPEKKVVSGVFVKLTLRGWEKISYFAFGLLTGGEYRHVKVMHPRQESQLDLEFSIYDITYQLQNGFGKNRPYTVEGVRLFLKGIPSSQGGVFEVENIAVFNQGEQEDFHIILSSGVELFSEIAFWWNQQKPDSPSMRLKEIFFQYDKKSYPNYHNSASYFMEGRGISLAKDTEVSAPVIAPLVDAISQNNTLRYSYHALNQVNSLLMVAESEGNTAPLFAARDLLSDWLDNNLFSGPQDKKYTWYDHGTAERQMVLIRMWHLGLTYKFDVRFMGRLLYAIKQHGDLLASESFYARDQNYRYHNHAIFQDLALLATTIAVPCLEYASTWREKALDRIAEQFDHLLITEGNCAVLKENSPGYHDGMLTIVEFLVRLLHQSKEKQLCIHFEGLLAKMRQFSNVICYSGGRLPAIGDTFRQPNSPHAVIKARKSEIIQGFWGLNKAGYVIAKGLHNKVTFQLTFYAPSLTKTHKHADHLSFTLFFDGVEWLIDPSFYSHQYTDPYPAYFRGPSAHNSIVLEGIEYSLEPNLSRIHSVCEGVFFNITGQHEAYQDTVISRSVNGRLDILNLDFSDHCQTSIKSKQYLLLFHLGETVSVQKVNNGFVLESNLSEYKLTLELPQQCLTEVHMGSSGETGSLLGWTGTKFCTVEQINTISCRVPVGTNVNWKLTANND